jgi:uncharacterized membrane protein
MIISEHSNLFCADISALKVSVFCGLRYQLSHGIINLHLVSLILINGYLNVYPLIVRYKNTFRSKLIEDTIVKDKKGNLVGLGLIDHE